jgi:putative phosphoserine phosphatase/1-acylglycerol-3-phosphate O-acyltransferase
VVIHNAGDVQPRTEFAMRPARVRVDVLPPVDTANWRAATIDRHVREVRDLFLRQLGQPVTASVRSTRKKRSPLRTKAPQRHQSAHAKRGGRST